MPFTDSPWSKPGGELSAEQYCSVCLIDDNPAGKKKVKDLCWLPVRSKPGAPFNKNAIRNAMGRIFAVKGASQESKRKAARRLVSLAREAKIDVTSDAILRLAGSRKK